MGWNSTCPISFGAKADWGLQQLICSLRASSPPFLDIQLSLKIKIKTYKKNQDNVFNWTRVRVRDKQYIRLSKRTSEC